MLPKGSPSITDSRKVRLRNGTNHCIIPHIEVKPLHPKVIFSFSFPHFFDNLNISFISTNLFWTINSSMITRSWSSFLHYESNPRTSLTVGCDDRCFPLPVPASFSMIWCSVLASTDKGIIQDQISGFMAKSLTHWQSVAFVLPKRPLYSPALSHLIWHGYHRLHRVLRAFITSSSMIYGSEKPHSREWS